MTRKRMVGPRSDGDFAMSIGMGGGRRGGASIIKKARKETAKPESSMKTKKKATRTKAQMSRLLRKLKKPGLVVDRGVDNIALGDRTITGREKGGLVREISKFKKTLTKQDKSDRKIVKAYKKLQKQKYDKDLAKSLRSAQKETLKETLEANFRSAQSYQQYFAGTNRSNAGRNPTVRKVIRKNKKLVKEKFKEQIKKDRAKRKLAESKKRRRRN